VLNANQTPYTDVTVGGKIANFFTPFLFEVADNSDYIGILE